jgi:hypothetical protein
MTNRSRAGCFVDRASWNINLLTPEFNPSAQRRLPRFFAEDLIFKGLTARRLYKSFGVKVLMRELRLNFGRKAIDVCSEFGNNVQCYALTLNLFLTTYTLNC